MDLNLIPCESLELLEDRLNSDFENGRGLRFHNSPSLFVKNSNGWVDEYIISSFLMRHKCEHIGFALLEQLRGEPDFFKIIKTKEFLSIQLPGVDPESHILIYGSGKDKKYLCEIEGIADSPEYSPVSGLLIPRETKVVSDFKAVDRIYLKR